MIIVEITRKETSVEHGTFGVLTINKELMCFTLEPSDRMNKIGASSIPTGQYICKPYSSARYPNVYQIMDVPGRTIILFHIGNLLEDTEGCVLQGKEIGVLKGKRAVLNSGKAFKQFRGIVGDNDFHLTITESY